MKMLPVKEHLSTLIHQKREKPEPYTSDRQECIFPRNVSLSQSELLCMNVLNHDDSVNIKKPILLQV